MNTKQAARTRRILSPSERDGLSMEIEENRKDKIEDDKFYPGKGGSVNDAQARKLKAVLDAGEPDSLSNNEKKKKLARRVQLVEFLQKHMLTKKETRLRANDNGSQNYEFVKSCHYMAEIEMSAGVVDAINEYRSLTFELFPDEPYLANPESIRPETR